MWVKENPVRCVKMYTFVGGKDTIIELVYFLLCQTVWLRERVGGRAFSKNQQAESSGGNSAYENANGSQIKPQK